MMPKVVNLESKFTSFSDYWNPRIIGKLNGQHVKIARLKGEFVMHTHEEDELFMVINGRLKIELQEDSITLSEGEMVVIPAGTPHKPIAKEEVKVLLFESASTVNTGDQPESDLTKLDLEEI